MKKPLMFANIQAMGVLVESSHYEKYGRKYYLKTREIRLAKNKEYYNANAERVIKRTTARTLKWRYNLTPEQLIELHKQQNNLCKICGNPPKIGRNLDVDHDHTTGKIRGLLCNNCNRGLGHLQDNITILQNAIEYLEKGTHANHDGEKPVREWEVVKEAKLVAKKQLEFYEEMMREKLDNHSCN
jgi:hypothetical protein